MKKLAIASLLALAAFAQPALAGSETGDVIVSYADLDLTTAAGQTTLDQRLGRAIRQICEPNAPRTARTNAAVRECIAEKRAEVASARSLAVAEAQAQRGNLALSQR